MSDKILIIGLGQIGYHNSQYIKNLGYKVDGYDINKKVIKKAIKNEIICKEAKSFHDYDYYIICVSTHNPNNIYSPFLDGLFSIAQRLAFEGKTDSLVGIESTIPIGTSEKIIDVLNHRLHVAHFPHRFYKEEKREHGVKQTRVLGGCETCCLDNAINFYGDLLGIPIHKTEGVEYAELSKLIENSFRYLEIAFAEELYIACDYLNLDFRTLRKAINSKWNIEILEAREGIDGHCLPKDSQMYLELVQKYLKNSLIENAKKVDEEYREHLEDKMLLKQEYDILVSSVIEAQKLKQH